ncbi:tripartite motif-containing protein 16-like protein isoform X1 [Lepisosteus oculatus]|uniref:tripartite motif-containing protein 16-like protein isoform X1 n=1 Tax=Lepisosteus oculatus TaxID=7918 RepID=UPI00371821E4
MASGGWGEEQFSCSVCLELLRDPVTIPCGHSYCRGCIERHWDGGAAAGVYSCPQCRRTFSPRPVVGRNTLLVELVEKLKEWGPPPPPPLPPPPAGPGTVLCDVCPRDKQSPDRRRRGQRALSAATGRAEKQEQLRAAQAETRAAIRRGEDELRQLRRAARTHKSSSCAAREQSREVFEELIGFFQSARLKVDELLVGHEEDAGGLTEALIQRLEQRVSELQRREAEMEQLSHTEDHSRFLQNFHTLCASLQPPDVPGVVPGPDLSFTAVRTAVSGLRERVVEVCNEELAKISETVKRTTVYTLSPGDTDVCANGACDPAGTVESGASATCTPVSPVEEDALCGLKLQEPRTREELLKYACPLSLDPDTAFRHLGLTEGDRRGTLRREAQPRPEHPDRFDYWRQVLCRQGLAGGRHYWEVEWSGPKVSIGACYRGMGRKGAGPQSRLGHNAKSWSLYCSGSGCSLWHDGKETAGGRARCPRVGVFLDHGAGVLAFYGVAEGVTLLHRVRAAFAEPLYPGFRLCSTVGSSMSLCPLD